MTRTTGCQRLSYSDLETAALAIAGCAVIAERYAARIAQGGPASGSKTADAGTGTKAAAAAVTTAASAPGSPAAAAAEAAAASSAVRPNTPYATEALAHV
jgi:hypothetical protein